MELLREVRRRNWQHPLFDPDAPLLTLRVYEDSGRALGPRFPGFRVLITREDGTQQWTDLPRPGQRAFFEDYAAGGGPGAIWRLKRSPSRPPIAPHEWGHEQFHEEVFSAFEPRLSARGRKRWESTLSVDPRERGAFDCPAERNLRVSFTRTDPEWSLAPYVDRLPSLAFLAFGFGFIFVSIGLGIFKPRKQMPSDPLQAMEFAQSKGKARRDGGVDVTFDDVAGIDSVRRDLQEIVGFLTDPGAARRMGVRAPKGVLLEGPPGTGKTLLAKAIAGEAGVPFYQMSGSEFVEVIVGVGAARVRDLFKRARARAAVGGCIIFVDEIDAVGIARAAAGQETNEEREQTLNQLLTEMDGFATDSGVVFLAATNRADLLDPALLRAGRFDRKIRVRVPDEKGRLEILQVHARRFKLADDVDLGLLARDLLGLSGAELENVLNEGALAAVRRLDAADGRVDGRLVGGASRDAAESDAITQADLTLAVDRITQGVRRPSLVPGGDDPDAVARRRAHPQMRAFAAHEAGTALVALVARAGGDDVESVERVSIVPRGQTLSRTVFSRGADEDYTVTPRSRLAARLRCLLAGRAAQDVLLGDEGGATTYASHTLRDALAVATKMVASYGLGQDGRVHRWAPVGYAPPTAGPFATQLADGDIVGPQTQESLFPPSDATLHAVRAGAARLVRAGYGDALAALRANEGALRALSDALLEREELDGAQVRAMIELAGGVRPSAAGDDGGAADAELGDWGRAAIDCPADLLEALFEGPSASGAATVAQTLDADIIVATTGGKSRAGGGESLGAFSLGNRPPLA